MHIENNIALETTTPDKIKDSKKAKNKITSQAYSALEFKYNYIFSNMLNWLVVNE
jgi:hypothetical protein